jgi:hypothetical protein
MQGSSEALTATQREAGMLDAAIAAAWRRFVLVEALVVWAPIFLVGALYVTTDFSVDVFYAAVGIAIAAMIVLTLYWVLRVVLPLQRRRAALEPPGL